jgi:hypothetical protein
MPITARKCTRCLDANGVPTGVVRGGECFLCRGAGTYVRQTVTAEAKLAGQRRAAAIQALRQAGITWRQSNARIELEESSPDRHAKLINSVLAGRVTDVLDGLTALADGGQA